MPRLGLVISTRIGDLKLVKGDPFQTYIFGGHISLTSFIVNID